MKFIVSSSALLKQLQQINGVINANTVLPILEDFLFEINKNKLTQVAVAQIFEVNQPRISDLVRGKIERFTIDMLVNMLARAGKHLNVKISSQAA